MKKKLFIRIFLIVIVFLVGYLTPNFIFATGQDGFLTVLRNMPQRGIFANLRNTGTLEPVTTYTNILDKINKNYYYKSDETKITYSGIHGMLLAFNDPFSNFFEPDKYKEMKEDNEGNFSGVGAILQVSDNGKILVKEVIKGAPADKAGILDGDFIIEVDGKLTAGRQLNDVVKDIRGPEKTPVKITVDRKGEHKTFTVIRDIVETINSKYKMLDEKNKIGYVSLSQFNKNADHEIDKALTSLENQGMEGLIFDLRGNPGGLLDMAVAISSRFVTKGNVVIIQSRGGERENLVVEKNKQNHKRVPLVILVNGNSASASEIVSGCVKDHGQGVIVGEPTFGKGLVQSLVPLNDGSAISITTAKYLTPNEIDIHKKGIEPDYFVAESENYDIDKEDTDDQLKAAKIILMNEMGIVHDSDLKILKENSDKLKGEFEKKLAEKLEKDKKKQ